MAHRYYIGLGLPTALSASIRSVQHELFDPAIAREPLEPHITLLPPPAVEHLSPDTLGPQAQIAATPFLPLTLTIDRVMTFDRRAIVIAVESPALHQLQKTLVGLLPPADRPHYFPMRAFHPHVTLNQAIRGQKLPQELYDAYQQRLASLLPTSCTIEHLTLYRWVRPRHYDAQTL